MIAPPYVELHLHTAYSFLDGASLPEELIGRAAELGYQALAVTDHDGLHGAMEFARAARAADIAPITGAELTLLDGSHLTLLAETPIGYANLCRLITAAHGGPYDGPLRHGEALPRLGPPSPGQGGASPVDRAPRLDPAILPAHADGLILLTGCRKGTLSRLIDVDQLPDAAALLRRYVEWFGPANVVVELQQNLVHGDTHRVAALVRLAERARLPYAATGNVHYHRQERHRLQDVQVAIRHRGTLDAAHRARRPNAEFFLRSHQEVADRFARYPAALRTTLAVAERCAGFDLTRDLSYAFPRYPTRTGETPDGVLADLCWRALVERYPDDGQTEAAARLEEELRLIALHRLGGFFLLYRDLLDLAREVAVEIRGADSQNVLPPGRGRGSSVGSIVCYLIGLSPVDPLAHDLMLGRFLNEEMSSVPDIDIDFPREIRERLIERVHERYGADHAAMVCAYPTYKLRSAVREVGKALGLPPTDLDRIAKLSEPRSARALGEELARMPEYAARLAAPPWCHLVELAGQLAGFPRHVSQHSGGMIVSSTPLVELVPVQPAAMAGRFLCQWDKDSCDDAGFVKIDFLALGMLSLVEECLELIVESGKPAVDLSRIDFADEPVYEMIRRGDTVGVFQIESRAQIQMLLRTQPSRLEHLVVQVAIVRPGPIIGGAVNPYVRHREWQRRHPGVPFQPDYLHPLLEPVLAETLGVVLYQEQVLGVAMALAGFSAGQADQLRRAMSRKRSREAMLNLWQQFRRGAEQNGVDPATTRTAFEQLLGFAEYGFPKSHAAAFALLAYQSSWLRCHYPAEFACALLNNQPMGFYAPHVLVNDAKRHGVRVLPPNVNESDVRCTVEGGAVRIGLGYVADLGEENAARLVRERQVDGPYRSLADLVRRVPLRPEAAENLVTIGAADGFGLGRREALWQLGLFLPARRFGGGRTAKEPGTQLPLALPVAQDMVELAPMGPWEQMANDYDTLGLSPRYHPLGLLRPRLPDGIASTADLATLPHGLLVRVAGLVVCRQRPGTAKGITFLLLEDEHGLINVIVYPALYDEQRHVVRGEPFLLIEGKLQRRDGTINVLAHRVRPLDGARSAVSPLSEANLPVARDLDVVPAKERAVEDERRIIDLRPIAPASHNYR
ncbi:MAG: Error-prone repair homolog of DNA polymerase III alpha subunit [uncultured Thermomicrobiales bacterium]|uniref:DNA polymerase III subunit alpha n=1 Tax=uncultured Thermomicrobiales bacterium TaxID=1645740 RepID=A0A6J4ULU8_9BACT|nr:MAG: Error-prone repair homolog of DNA polymerase III alpha subunit [uncultured Thermomicrobiales bacterium]